MNAAALAENSSRARFRLVVSAQSTAEATSLVMHAGPSFECIKHARPSLAAKLQTGFQLRRSLTCKLAIILCSTSSGKVRSAASFLALCSTAVPPLFCMTEEKEHRDSVLISALLRTSNYSRFGKFVGRVEGEKGYKPAG